MFDEKAALTIALLIHEFPYVPKNFWIVHPFLITHPDFNAKLEASMKEYVEYHTFKLMCDGVDRESAIAISEAGLLVKTRQIYSALNENK